MHFSLPFTAQIHPFAPHFLLLHSSLSLHSTVLHLQIITLIRHTVLFLPYPLPSFPSYTPISSFPWFTLYCTSILYYLLSYFPFITLYHLPMSIPFIYNFKNIYWRNIEFELLEVLLPCDPSCPSVGWSVGRLVCHDFLSYTSMHLSTSYSRLKRKFLPMKIFDLASTSRWGRSPVCWPVGLAGQPGQR